MRKLILVFTIILFSCFSFSQEHPWQGEGTVENPFKIFTIDDLNTIRQYENDPLYYFLVDDESIHIPVSYYNMHFELMNNIDDSLTHRLCNDFGGHFHGKGHYIRLNYNTPSGETGEFIGSVLCGSIDSLRLEGNMFNSYGIFGGVGGEINHLICNLNVKAQVWNINTTLYLFCNGITGTFKNCINYSDINIDANKYISCGFFENGNGVIDGFINYGNFNIETTNESIVEAWVLIKASSADIKNCVNYGNFTINGIPEFANVSIMSMGSHGTISNCLNTGDIFAKKVDVLGVFSSWNFGNVINCVNTGRVIGDKITGGIVGTNYEPGLVKNCLNAGYVQGDSISGGIVGNNYGGSAKNNLSLYKTYGYSIFGDSIDNSQQFYPDSLMFENNFYDKQLLTQMSSPEGDILENNAAKGLLTTEITGFALQDILGDDWSYAEGRYPIPLGLENHPAAQLAATPMYLPYTDQDDYNTVDSVTCHFMLGTENNVEWECGYPSVNLEETEDGLKGVLQTTGFVNLVASLGNYHKNIILNIKSVCDPVYKNEEIQKTQAIAYPNPTKDILYFNQASAYEIYDLQGKLIMKSKKPQNFVNTSKLKSGIYLIKIGGEIMKFVVE
ncbi:MAG TPA: T9SS type A sorting domain-containing protein [Bacteroidales bacterium]|nr:T9SS type A sorting domain-containing protein [Bacteroidales bacterium]